MATVVFVGQGTSKSTAESGPFTGSSAKRLADFIGMSLEEFKAGFRTMNVFDGWPGKRGRGDAFDLRTARTAATEIMKAKGYYICLGKNVANAFGIVKAPMLQWQALGDSQVAWLPHTSGLNLFYNKPANRKAVADGLRRLLAEVE